MLLRPAGERKIMVILSNPCSTNEGVTQSHWVTDLAEQRQTLIQHIRSLGKMEVMSQVRERPGSVPAVVGFTSQNKCLLNQHLCSRLITKQTGKCPGTVQGLRVQRGGKGGICLKQAL